MKTTILAAFAAIALTACGTPRTCPEPFGCIYTGGGHGAGKAASVGSPSVGSGGKSSPPGNPGKGTGPGKGGAGKGDGKSGNHGKGGHTAGNGKGHGKGKGGHK